MIKQHKLIGILSSIGISNFATELFSFYCSYLVLNLTGSGLSFGFSLLLQFIPRILLADLFGKLVDRNNRKTILILCDFICFITLSIFFLLSSDNILLLYFTIVLLSIVNLLYDITLTAIIPILKNVSTNNISQVNGFVQTLNSISRIISPILSGVLISKNRFILVIIVLSIFLISGIWKFKIEICEDYTNELHEKKLRKSDLPKVSIRNNSMVKTIIQNDMLLNLAWTLGISVNFTYFIIYKYDLGTEMLGLLSTISAIGSFSGAYTKTLIKSKDTTKEVKYPYSNVFILGIGLFIYAVIIYFSDIKKISPLIWLGIIKFLLSFVLTVTNININTCIQTNVRSDELGRVYGMMEFYSSLLIPIAYLIGGFLLDIVPQKYLFLIPFCSALLFLILVLKLSYSDKKQNKREYENDK